MYIATTAVLELSHLGMKSYEVGSLAPEHLPTCNLFLMSKSVT